LKISRYASSSFPIFFATPHFLTQLDNHRQWITRPGFTLLCLVLYLLRSRTFLSFHAARFTSSRVLQDLCCKWLEAFSSHSFSWLLNSHEGCLSHQRQVLPPAISTESSLLHSQSHKQPSLSTGLASSQFKIQDCAFLRDRDQRTFGFIVFLTARLSTAIQRPVKVPRPA
jgi:hypothetical protein